MDETKTCTGCGETKLLNEFTKDNRKKDGRGARCRKCVAAKVGDWRRTPTGRELFRNSQAAYVRSEGGRATRRKSRRVLDAKSPVRSLYFSIYNALKRRPSDNPVTLDQLLSMWTAQDGRCALSGVEMTWGARHGLGRAHARSISIDRKDQSRGYEADNVRLVCHAINDFRGSQSDVDMLDLACKLLSHNGYRVTKE